MTDVYRVFLTVEVTAESPEDARDLVDEGEGTLLSIQVRQGPFAAPGPTWNGEIDGNSVRLRRMR